MNGPDKRHVRNRNENQAESYKIDAEAQRKWLAHFNEQRPSTTRGIVLEQRTAFYAVSDDEKYTTYPRLSFPPANVAGGALLRLQHQQAQAGQLQPLVTTLCPTQC